MLGSSNIQFAIAEVNTFMTSRNATAKKCEWKCLAPPKKGILFQNLWHFGKKYLIIRIPIKQAVCGSDVCWLMATEDLKQNKALVQHTSPLGSGLRRNQKNYKFTLSPTILEVEHGCI